MFQPISKKLMKILSYNSRILSTQEQNLATYNKEKCAVSFNLTSYKFPFIGSIFLITLIADEVPLLFFITRKGNLTPRQYEAQTFSERQKIHTAGYNLTIAELVSRGSSKTSDNSCQSKLKTLPP